MAILIWNGQESGQIGKWSHAANWKLTDGSSSSAIPTSGDDVYFTSGSQDVQADTCATVTVGTLNFGVKYTGSFVTVVNATSGETTNTTIASTPCSATTVDFAKRQGYISLKGTYTTINIKQTSTDSPALNLDDATITTLNITGGQGTVYVDAGSTISGAINMVGCKGARLEIQAGATVSAADITIDAGRVLSYEQLDTVTQYGGVVNMQNVDGTTNTITIFQGTCKYQPTGAAVLTTLTNYGGFFDLRGCKSPAHTITNATLYGNAMIDERNGLSNTTWTNPITVNSGIVKADTGRTIAIT
jgi:hypothetical protein